MPDAQKKGLNNTILYTPTTTQLCHFGAQQYGNYMQRKICFEINLLKFLL